MKLYKIQDTLEWIHKKSADLYTKKLKQALDLHNERTGARPEIFFLGDFVVKGILHREKSSRRAILRSGPFRVVECKYEKKTFVIEDFLIAQNIITNGRRLEFLRISPLEVTEYVHGKIYYREEKFLRIERLEYVRTTGNRTVVTVKWRGFYQVENDCVGLKSM